MFDALKGAGFAVVDPPGNADRNDYDDDRGPLRAEGSDDLAKYTKLAYLGGAGKLVEVDSLPAGTDIELVLGRDFTAVNVAGHDHDPDTRDHARARPRPEDSAQSRRRRHRAACRLLTERAPVTFPPCTSQSSARGTSD